MTRGWTKLKISGSIKQKGTEGVPASGLKLCEKAKIPSCKLQYNHSCVDFSYPDNFNYPDSCVSG